MEHSDLETLWTSSVDVPLLFGNPFAHDLSAHGATHSLFVRKTLCMRAVKGSLMLFSTLTWTTFHRSPLRSMKEPCSGTDLSPSMSRSISSVVGSPLYRNTICLAGFTFLPPVN